MAVAMTTTNNNARQEKTRFHASLFLSCRTRGNSIVKMAPTAYSDFT